MSPAFLISHASQGLVIAKGHWNLPGHPTLVMESVGLLWSAGRLTLARGFPQASVRILSGVDDMLEA